MENRIIGKFRSFLLFVNYFKLTAWIVFLLLFSPICMMNGLYGGALFLAALGLFIDFAIFHKGILPMDAENQKILARFFVAEHSTVAIIAIFLMLQPIEGGWERIVYTEQWSDPVLLSLNKGRFAAFVTVNSTRKLFLTSDAGKTWEDTNSPCGFGWKMNYDPRRNELFVVPRGRTVIYRLVIGKSEWDEFVRPPGEQIDTALNGNLFYFVGSGRLYVYYRDKNEWSYISRAAFPVHSVAVSPDSMHPVTLIVGKYWMEYQGGDRWNYTGPIDAGIDLPDAVVGGGGWRYIFEGGLISGKLFVAGPDKEYREGKLPAPDIRIMVANPTDGKEVWVGTWGQGVYRSKNAGRSWRYMGLKRIQIRSMAIDFENRIALAGSSNLLFEKGVYLLRYGK